MNQESGNSGLNARIRGLTASNFRSLGDNVNVNFGPLTVLVGPNGSGKSNVVDVLRFVAESLRLGLEAAITKRHGIGALRRRSLGHPYDVSLLIAADGQDWNGSYELVIGGDKVNDYHIKREQAFCEIRGRAEFLTVERGEVKSAPSGLSPKPDVQALALPLAAGDERLRPLYDALRSLAVYSIYPDTLREPQRPDPSTPMQEHGGNWCSVLKDMPRARWANDLRAAMAHVTGDIVDLRVKQTGGYLAVEFRHASSLEEADKGRRQWFDSGQESDGTLRVAGILTALLQEPALTLVGIEEPELTVHPGAIPLIFDYIREAATRSQVILTTHSPDLLDLLDVDEIRVVQRMSGVTTVRSVDAEQRDLVRRRLMTPGEVLRTEGLRQSTDAVA